MGSFSIQVVLSLSLFVGVVFSGVHIVKPGEYLLEWDVSDGNLTVTATAKTLGFVGFGLSPYGSMMEADVIFAGRYANGTGYVQVKIKIIINPSIYLALLANTVHRQTRSAMQVVSLLPASTHKYM